MTTLPFMFYYLVCIPLCISSYAFYHFLLLRWFQILSWLSSFPLSLSLLSSVYPLGGWIHTESLTQHVCVWILTKSLFLSQLSLLRTRPSCPHSWQPSLLGCPTVKPHYHGESLTYLFESVLPLHCLFRNVTSSPATLVSCLRCRIGFPADLAEAEPTLICPPLLPKLTF